MASILKVDTIQDQSGNNIINESANTITIGASGDTITIPSGATLANSGIITGFESTGIDDNATSTAITIDSGQRVRINNTTSTGHGNIYNLIVGNESSGGDSGILITAPNNENSYVSFGDSDGVLGLINYNHNSNFLRTYVNGSEAMRIDSSGNVGIGTSSPGANLHIESSSGETGTLIKTTASDTGVNLTLNGNKTSNTGGIGSIQFQNSGDSVGMIRSFRESANDAGGLSFWTQATGGSNSERMRIDSSGNVGIGTSSPQEKLDIDGNIAISGNTLFEEVTSTAGMPSSAGNKSVNTDYDSTFSLTAGKWLILVNASLQVFQTSGNESGLYLLSLSLGSSAGADDYGLIQKAVLKWGNGSNSYGDNTGGHFPTLTLGSTTTLHTRWRVTEYGTASNFWVRGNLTRIRCIRIG